MAGTEPSLTQLLFADVYRFAGQTGWPAVARQFVTVDTYRYNVALRVAAAARARPAAFLARLWLRRLRTRLGINIPAPTRIGPGLFIGHAGGIVVNAGVVIGRDCNLSHNVTIGVSHGKRPGVPVIGDRVYIGPGAVVFGAIRVGDDVAVGANAVVLEDVPAGATVVGGAARVLLNRGSARHVHHTTEAIVRAE